MLKLNAIRTWQALGATGALAVLIASAALGQDDLVARGKYLNEIGECAGCHSDKAGRYAGGREFHTKFGIVESANITPDVQTGIGAWSADDFYRALHTGRSRAGYHLYPAFPYPYFTKVTRADTDALYAYLKTVPPVSNAPHRNRLHFPFSLRGFVGVWNALYFKEGEYRADPGQSAEWNRGAYLAQSLAHCGACHSPKNALEADSRSHPYEGGMIEGWFAPNITGEPRTGLGNWSHEDLVQFLRTGQNPHTAAGGMMAGVVQGSLSQIDEADVRAIAAYIKSLPASAPPRPAHPDAAAMSRGEAVYARACASCHDRGEGGVLPPLGGSPHVQASNPTTLVRFVLNGTRTAVTPAHPEPAVMPGFAGKLSDGEIADVMTYIRNSWGNVAGPVGTREAAKVRAAAPPPPPPPA